MKEQFNERIIDSSLRKITETNELIIHFVYAGPYIHPFSEASLRSIILKGIKKHKIKRSVMVTMIDMTRFNLITKENMENYCKGKDDDVKESVNEDLESLFEDIRVGKEPDEDVSTYFLPKLTEEELKLVDRKDPNYLETFFNKTNADVEEAEMKLSESNSKFVRAQCYRRTFTIKEDSSS